MLKKPEDKKQLGDFFGMSNSYAECYPATYVRCVKEGRLGGLENKWDERLGRHLICWDPG